MEHHIRCLGSISYVHQELIDIINSSYYIKHMPNYSIYLLEIDMNSSQLSNKKNIFYYLIPSVY